MLSSHWEKQLRCWLHLEIAGILLFKKLYVCYRGRRWSSKTASFEAHKGICFVLETFIYVCDIFLPRYWCLGPAHCEIEEICLSFIWFQHYEAPGRADIDHLRLMRINVVKSVILCSVWWTKPFWEPSFCMCSVWIMEATVSMTILDTVSPSLLFLPLFINSCPQTIVVLHKLPGYSQKTIDSTFDPTSCQNRVSALPQGRPQRHVTGSQWCNEATIPNSLSLPSFLRYTLWQSSDCHRKFIYHHIE